MNTDIRASESTKKLADAKHSGGDNLSSTVWQSMANERKKQHHPANAKPHSEDGPKIEAFKDGLHKKIDHTFTSKGTSKEFTTGEALDRDVHQYEPPKAKNAPEGSRDVIKRIEDPKLPKDVEAALEKMLAKWGHSESPKHTTTQKPHDGPSNPLHKLYPTETPTGISHGTVEKPTAPAPGPGDKPMHPLQKPAVVETPHSKSATVIHLPHVTLWGPASPTPY